MSYLKSQRCRCCLDVYISDHFLVLLRNIYCSFKSMIDFGLNVTGFLKKKKCVVFSKYFSLNWGSKLLLCFLLNWSTLYLKCSPLQYRNNFCWCVLSDANLTQTKSCLWNWNPIFEKSFNVWFCLYDVSYLAMIFFLYPLGALGVKRITHYFYCIISS